MTKRWIVFLLILLISCAPKPISIPQTGHEIYLPVVLYNDLVQLGVNTWETPSASAEYIVPHGLVSYALFWSDVETTQGSYDWEYPDTQIASIDRNKSKLIISIRNTPLWARTVPLYECSQPHETYYPDFSAFVNAVEARYSPDYIEIWNEPDVSYLDISVEYARFMGCWGNDFDAGREFGLFVEYATRDLDTPVMAGGFGFPFEDFIVGYSAVNPPINYVSFHAYAHYQWGDWDRLFDNSDRISLYLDRPQFVTETSYLCDNNCGTEFEQLQSDYLHYLYLTAPDYPIEGVLWFTMNNSGDWRHADLINRPAWNMYQALLVPIW